MEGHGAALTELCRLMDMGHVPHAIGEPRNAEVCGACGQAAFGPEADKPGERDPGMNPVLNQICQYCDAWTHCGDCVVERRKDHAVRNLCRGLRIHEKFLTEKDLSIAEEDPDSVREAPDVQSSGENFIRRKEMQGHSSDEEQMPCVLWCSACGDLVVIEEPRNAS